MKSSLPYGGQCPVAALRMACVTSGDEPAILSLMKARFGGIKLGEDMIDRRDFCKAESDDKSYKIQ